MTILSVLQPLNHPLFIKHKIQVSIKRDDQIHPIISGNKWRKLKYNLLHLKEQNKVSNTQMGVLSFGGSYSNHIHALAFACMQQNIPCIGIIRGEESNHKNFTLSWAKHWGMTLHFVDRKTYRRRHDVDFLAELASQYPNHFIIPEGGSNKLALQGVGEVITELNQQSEFDTLILPVGSGGTLAGLVASDNNQHNILGVCVLKDGAYLQESIHNLLPEKSSSYNHWQLLTQFHCGGYAKFKSQDICKIIEFSKITGVNFEPIYSGKMILALLKLIEQGYFPENHRIVLIHTGGLQGIAGMVERGLLERNDWTMPKYP